MRLKYKGRFYRCIYIVGMFGSEEVGHLRPSKNLQENRYIQDHKQLEPVFLTLYTFIKSVSKSFSANKNVNFHIKIFIS